MNDSSAAALPTIFISSLGHSGSTLLDVALSCSAGTVGLGEAYYFLKGAPFTRRLPICQCGSHYQQCPLWGPVDAWISEHPQAKVVERYRQLHSHIRDLFGPIVVIDSSKTAEALGALGELGGPIRTVRLLRAPAEWAKNQKGRASRGDTKAHRADPGLGWLRSTARGLKLGLANQPIPLHYTWHRMNLELDRAAESHRTAPVRVWFDDLATDPVASLGHLRTALGLDPVVDEYDLAGAGHQHQLLGNGRGRRSERISASHVTGARPPVGAPLLARRAIRYAAGRGD